MKYFEEYSSNTYAGSGNQLFFEADAQKKSTGRLFYKITVGGKYNYSVLFSNIMDSTYADGSVSHKNLICDAWVIHNAKIGRCKAADMPGNFSELIARRESIDIPVSDFKDIRFDGQQTKNVMP